MSRFKLAPSILSADFARLGEEVRAAEDAGADWIHFDVMDGQFVPNITVGPGVLEAVARSTSLPCDVHLMIERPELHIQSFIDAGARTVGVHVETCPHLHRTLQQIRSAGARACAVLNPSTPAILLREVLPCLDQILVMTVNPGFGGQSFIAETMPKLYEIRKWIELGRHAIDLEVDGGIALDTIEIAAQNGANAFVMGSAFYRCEGRDYKRFVEAVRARLEPYE